MKRILCWLLIALSMVVSCKMEAEAALSMTGPRTISFTKEGGTHSFAFSCNREWSVTSTETWCQVTPPSGHAGTGDIYISLTCEPNQTYNPRTCTLTINSGELEEDLTVRQGQNYGLFITSPEYELSNNAHTLSVVVKANVELEVTPQADWIKYIDTKGLVSSVVTLDVEANSSYDDRTGTVLVKQTNGDLSGVITITQKQTDAVIVEPVSIEVDNKEQTVELNVKNNVSYSVVIPASAQDWISITQTKALTEDKVTLIIAKNADYDDREASITVKQTDGPATQTVTVKQGQNLGLFITNSDFQVLSSGQTLEVEVKANVEFEVTSEVDWIQYIITKALSSSTIVLSVDKNDAFQERTGTVNVRQTNGSLSGTITIKQASAPKPPKEGFIVVGYATYWDSKMPDPTFLTHINYSFAHIKSDFESLDIKTPSRLSKIAALKNTYPDLKVLLSVGGWGAGNFSEMAADASHRAKFCQNCKNAVQQYGLDGIDLDWEYPTSSEAGISSSPDDTRNFTLLVQELRSALGTDKLLTMASDASADYVDFVSAGPYLDFINVMTYCMGKPPYHNAGLYPSSMTKRSCSESVTKHYNAGVPYDKMVMGIPFFGHDGTEEVNFCDINIGTNTKKWDDDAKVPYLVNSSGKMVLTYDDAESVGLKASYIKEKDLLGAMYWNIEADDDNWTLSKTIAATLLDWEEPEEPEEPSADAFLATNQYVEKFLEEVDYGDSEYTYSSVIGYPGGGPSVNNEEIPPTYTIQWTASSSGTQELTVWEGDWSRKYSISAGVGKQDITNLVPGTEYQWKVTRSSGSVNVASGSFKTRGHLHQVFYEPNVRNGRDLGGYKGFNGKTVSYHKLYRGGQIDGKYCNSNGRKEMLAEGIKAEVDLREAEDVPSKSPLGSSISFYAPGFDSGYNHMVRDNPEKVKNTFCWVVARLKEGKPVYFHCAAGRDRTATLAILLLGSLGVSESDMAKDYELTYFTPSDWGMSKDDDGNPVYKHTRDNYSYKSVKTTVYNQTNSGTYQERIIKYLLKIGVTQQEIDDYQRIMLK